MPDDFVVNVRQIGQYPQKTTPLPSDAFLLQAGGAGGAYNWMAPDDLVSGALLNSSKYLRLSASSGIAFNGAALTYAAGGFNFSEALYAKGIATDGSIVANDILMDGARVATQVYVSDVVASVDTKIATAVNNLNTTINNYLSGLNASVNALGDEVGGVQSSVQSYVTDSLNAMQAWVAQQVAGAVAGVTSWNGRTGDVVLTLHDIVFVGGAPIDSPHFTGRPRAPTPWDVRQSDDVVATTAFVQAAVCQFMNDLLTNQPFVFTFNGRKGNVVLTTEDVTNAYFTVDGDVPQAPNPAPFDSSNRIPTTSWVGDEIATQINYVLEQLDFDLQKLLDYLATIYAPINSPAFVGIPMAPTAAPGTNTDQLATTAFVMEAVALSTTGVATWNGRTGNVVMNTQDIIDAGGAPLNNPVFTGFPQAPTPTPGRNDQTIATTAFVQNAISSAIAALPPGVTSWNGRTGAVLLTLADMTGAGAFNNTILTGSPIAPTPPASDNSDRLATTAFVRQVTNAIIGASVRSFNGRTGDVTLDLVDVTKVGGAPINSPNFTGIPTAPTAAVGTSTTQIATTQFVNNTLLNYAPIQSPVFTGNPQAPTPAPGDNDTSIATTAFVNQAINAFSQNIVLSFDGRTGAVVLNLTDITDAGGAPIQDPVFTGNPQAPTPPPGDSSTSIATTAFVQNAVAGLQSGIIISDTPPPTGNDGDIYYNPTTGDLFVWNNNQWNLVGGGGGTAGVSSFNTRTGDVVLTLADVTGVGGAPINDPSFGGVPMAPTAAVGTNTDQIATTAYVLAAVAAATAGVASWNGRTGDVVMDSADIIAAGGAPLTNPVFLGDPQAPTPPPGDNDASIATTAFVTYAINTAIAAGAVTSWNTRSGAVTMVAADITAAGGALLASPTFTGIPAAPTAAPGTSTTQLATTAFVQAAVASITAPPASAISITPIGNQTWTTVQEALQGIYSIANSALQSVAVDGTSITGSGTTASPIAVTAPTDKPYGRMNGNWVGVQPLTIVSATAPANPQPGRLWWDEVSGQLFVWYDDGNSQQWVIANASASGAAAGGISDAPADSVLYARRNGIWTPVQITVPVGFVLTGKPLASQSILLPTSVPLTVAAGLVGSTTVARVAPAAAAVFAVNKISSGGTTTPLGTITASAGQLGGWTLAGGGGSLAVGEAMELVSPATQDANLADVGVTILATRA